MCSPYSAVDTFCGVAPAAGAGEAVGVVAGVFVGSARGTVDEFWVVDMIESIAPTNAPALRGRT